MAVLSFQQARDIVIEQARRLRYARSIERVSLLRSAGRVLAEAAHADRDFPPFDRATRDGYALRSSDLSSIPALLKLIGQAKAGTTYEGRVEAGECVEIMTGAPVPDGADAVVMVEYTLQEGNSIRITRGVAAAENIVTRGSEAHRDDLLLPVGRRIGAAEIAVLAAIGNQNVSVFQRPKVAILPTGDEVVELNAAPGPSQIRNSNSYALQAQVAAAGGIPLALGIGPDEEKVLQAMIEEGLRADMLLLSGGVSAGKFDLVEGVLARLGAEFFFEGVNIQPGRPLVVGRVGKTLFFGLPGNPISTIVTFELFARPALAMLHGEEPAPLVFTRAKLAADLRRKAGLTAFLPATLSGSAFEPVVAPVQWKGSGDIVSLSRANCYLVIPESADGCSAGEWVSILLRDTGSGGVIEGGK